MPNCKICGKPVQCASVHHAACWETQAHKVAEEFCNNYCKFHDKCKDEDELVELHCSDCALVRLLNLGL